jgi:regulator of ribonuclease activity A
LIISLINALYWKTPSLAWAKPAYHAAMDFATADLCDLHAAGLQILDPGFRHFGGRRAFHGPVATVSCFEDNSRVRERLQTPGEGRVLVVDGGGSPRCALLGDRLAQLAIDNGWAGVLIHGMIRDSAVIAGMPLAVMALGTHPKKSEKRGVGQTDVPLRFGGVDFRPGHWLYADSDGLLLSPEPLPPAVERQP